MYPPGGFDLKEDDVFWCTADVGWVTGHSYLAYGPLANGATCVMYEGAPDWPDKDRFWQIVEELGVTIFYTAPTAIRAFMKWGPEWPAKHRLTSLRLLGSVGEPINPEAWVWYHKHIGGEICPIVDMWWQTETGMILISPLPGVTVTRPGSATRPLPGIDADIVNGRAFIWRHQGDLPAQYFINSFERNPDEPKTVFRTLRVEGDHDVIKDIDAAGAACLLIKRRVLEDPRMRQDPRHVSPEGEARNLVPFV